MWVNAQKFIFVSRVKISLSVLEARSMVMGTTSTLVLERRQSLGWDINSLLSLQRNTKNE